MLDIPLTDTIFHPNSITSNHMFFILSFTISISSKNFKNSNCSNLFFQVF